MSTSLAVRRARSTGLPTLHNLPKLGFDVGRPHHALRTFRGTTETLVVLDCLPQRCMHHFPRQEGLDPVQAQGFVKLPKDGFHHVEGIQGRPLVYQFRRHGMRSHFEIDMSSYSILTCTWVMRRCTEQTWTARIPHRGLHGDDRVKYAPGHPDTGGTMVQETRTERPRIVPMIAYEDGAAAIDWLVRAFGFRELDRITGSDGTISHAELDVEGGRIFLDRKSTRLNSSHLVISYSVFCLAKKKQNTRSY